MTDKEASAAPRRCARPSSRRMWSRNGTLSLVAALLAAVALVAAVPAGASSGYTTSNISLSDTGHLHLTSHHSFTLNEQGSASGTISGPIYIHLNVVSTNHVTAEVSIYPSGGSITGRATASYHPSGAVATFAGTMTVVRGTGRYAGANGSGLSFTGTVQRTNDAVTVRVSGRMST
ncbi:MAG TPA: hypothetical protein VK655_02670 [Solirubrobacteraceae bacterium]|jgi:hypothetical protein|nr:hypothetical protein [Solirubrobacteraceae bacterium]